MNALIMLISTVIDVFIYMILARVILGWLVQFNVVNRSQPLVASIGAGLTQITEPVFRPVRNLLSRIGLGNIGGIDFSPMVVILLLFFVRNLFVFDIAPLLR